MGKNPTYEELINRIQVLERIELNHRLIEKDLQHQTQTHKVLMNIAAGCINIQFGKEKGAIQSALETIGQFVRADRAYIFKYDFEKNIAVNTYEWCNQDVEPQIENLQAYPLEGSSDWVEPHLLGKILAIADVSALPSGATRDILEQQKIKSLIAVPFFLDDQLVGFTGFDSVKKFHAHSEREIELLKFFARILANLRMYTEAEKALRESEKRFRKIIEDVSEISIQGYDEKRQVIFWNGASENLYGYSEKEALGKKLEDLIIPPNMREQIKMLHSRWVEYGEKIPAGELILIDKNGNDVPVFSSHVMHETLHGKEMYCIDINLKPLKLAEKEKIKAQKIASDQKKLALIGQVAGKMAHDFNNILGIIMGNTELSLLYCKDTQTRKTLELIFDQTLRGKNLTKNLIAFAKSQEPKQEFFRISEKIDLVLNLMKKDLEGISLIKEDGSNVPDLLADPGMIEHALVNLVQNSIHAVSMVKNPVIVVRSFCLKNNICIEIEDNGCGIPKDSLNNIYEPSFTLKGNNDITGSYKPGIKGTGYGMSNIKKYIKQHKGSIFVESKVGSGTIFTISLPIIKKELTREEKKEIQEGFVCFDKYILLVEDEQSLSDVQYRILTQEPCCHKVDIANNGQVAKDLFDRNKYDFISLDYVLPGGINGMDIYHHIRTTNKIIPILFVSGNIEFLESIKELKQKDVYINHVSKPCPNKEYVSEINKLIELTIF